METSNDSLKETQEWGTYTERLWRVTGSTLKVVLITLVLFVAIIFLSYYGYVATGQFALIDSLLSNIVLIISTIVLFIYLPSAIMIAKKSLLSTIGSLQFKDSLDREKFMSRDSVYTPKMIAGGLLIWIPGETLAISINPLFTGDFPLTLEILPIFVVKLILWCVMNLIVLDAAIILVRVLVISNLIADNLEIRPLESDRCGGVKALGDLYFLLSALIAIAGTIIVAASSGFEDELMGYLMAGIYGLIAIVIFIVPQNSVSKLMKEKKKAHLDRISKQLEEVRKVIDNPDQEALMVTFIKMQSYIMLYEQYEKFREYPFDVGTLRNVITTGLLPIILKFAMPFLGIFGTILSVFG